VNKEGSFLLTKTMGAFDGVQTHTCPNMSHMLATIHSSKF